MSTTLPTKIPTATQISSIILLPHRRRLEDVFESIILQIKEKERKQQKFFIDAIKKQENEEDADSDYIPTESESESESESDKGDNQLDSTPKVNSVPVNESDDVPNLNSLISDNTSSSLIVPSKTEASNNKIPVISTKKILKRKREKKIDNQNQIDKVRQFLEACTSYKLYNDTFVTKINK
jgi:hypothetical protein